jgi:hypothetical protein
MNENKSRKPYKKPEIIHELDLETRAGSTPEVNELEDPFEIES